ncbi:Predicted antitoxin, CopG family [Haladaptatus litoreus]|uniref:Predicted antitoxin, CopG family n=1 Tax=Haladaptatus litoreus TaxID=553468 RepID=A0A1N7EY95_9EURY|nr:antitoxin VapB family protein [Haladaptatus litoreus]SIR93012.1 Predicted antitoxin, CopG family [Haladaptatus litoreus]
MGIANDQIRVSDTVKRELERRKREGESFNDVLERMLGDNSGDFADGFGRWSDEEAERVREGRKQGKEKRKARMQRLGRGDA